MLSINAYKVFLGFFLLAIIQILFYLFIEHNLFVENIQTRSLDNALKKAKEREKYFLGEVNQLASIINLSAISIQFKQYRQDGSGDINHFFLDILRTHQDIFQLRYIDASGMEKLRIERQPNSDKPYIVENLQDKSQRDYFIQAKNAKNEKIFYSNLDLNIENGAIQKPFIPVIRVGIPIKKDGEFDGLLIANYFMGELIQKFVNAPLYDIILSDNEGYPLYHYKKEHSWGRYLDKPYTIHNEFGSDIKHILSNKSYRNKTLFSQKLDLPFSNKLYVIFQLNSAYLDSMIEQNTKRTIFVLGLLLIVIIISSSILSIWVSGAIKKINKQKDIAEKANMTKSLFLANMSHEIRTPMSAILGFIDRLKKTETSQERIKQFQIIENSGKTLLNIINDILDLSKIESGRVSIDLHRSDINELIIQTTVLLEQTIKDKEIDLVINLDSSIYMCVMIDEIRLQQVLLNLLSNAIKFTPIKGNITLETMFEKESGMFQCSIIDNGIGIDQENQEKIFKAFNQEDSTVTRKFGGTGLGLSISSQLIEAMGGKLKVESKLNEGSHFYFDIPIKRCRSEKELFFDKQNTSTNFKNETNKDVKLNAHILIVEDNKTNQMLLSMILDDVGVTYDIANDGIEAVNMHKSKHYDIIMMDENMPNMNGIEATKHIKETEQNEGKTKTCIIAVTANAFDGDSERFIAAGFDEYISKPYSVNDIINALQRNLRR